MAPSLSEQQQRYAELVLSVGLNLQRGQPLLIRAEPVLRQFIVQLTESAYRLGASYVQIEWDDPLIAKARLAHGDPDYLDRVPDGDVARYREVVDQDWAFLRIHGKEFPHLFDDVDPAHLRRQDMARIKRTAFLSHAVSSSAIQWAIAAAPTPRWAKQLFPARPEHDAVAELWAIILRVTRADLPDPIGAWREHLARLDRLATRLADEGVTGLHFLDAECAADGAPKTDLFVGLAERAVWRTAMATSPKGVRFLRNLPTEEIFTAPHAQRVSGHVRTSKTSSFFNRHVHDALFRFDGGELVGYSAAGGQEVLEQFFQADGSRRLGEIALVDGSSPVNRTGLVFDNILFDENASCHLAFGRAVLDCVEGAAGASEDQLKARGVNFGDVHWDLMIGTPTMDVDGLDSAGRRIAVLRQGRFVESLLA